MSVQGGHTHFLHLGPVVQQSLLLEVTVLILLVVFAFSSDLLLVAHDCMLLRLVNTASILFREDAKLEHQVYQQELEEPKS